MVVSNQRITKQRLARRPPGLGSFFGMSVSNDAAGGDLNAAAQEFMGSIKNGSSSYFLATGITSSVSLLKCL